ncbi:hypothetical protein M7I_7536 [Glarea lozoyensis 74030]|uniref:Uncharacterized protein n=1 Tax=Glarea lozoyensis (strain ATCC 74030 / MF5533) TaxID=1104152 RepID=H0EXK0_GLAL7|nr:hypothetical protein M7I_7536 [Glarea lozoyensis 74030]
MRIPFQVHDISVVRWRDMPGVYCSISLYYKNKTENSES